MPSGVYKRTKKQIQQIHDLGKAPKTQKQINGCRKGGLKGKGKSRKGRVFADSIVEHHNDLQHGAIRPNDISLMSHSEHTSLHANLRVQNGTNPFLAKKSESHCNAKLKEQDIFEIRDLIKSGSPRTHIANKFNVCPRTISHIESGNTWNWLTKINF